MSRSGGCRKALNESNARSATALIAADADTAMPKGAVRSVLFL